MKCSQVASIFLSIAERMLEVTTVFAENDVAALKIVV
jgi:hypothetical protein